MSFDVHMPCHGVNTPTYVHININKHLIKEEKIIVFERKGIELEIIFFWPKHIINTNYDSRETNNSNNNKI